MHYNITDNILKMFQFFFTSAIGKKKKIDFNMILKKTVIDKSVIEKLFNNK